MKSRLLLVTAMALFLNACAGLEETATEETSSPEQNTLKMQDRMNDLHLNIVRMAEQGSCTDHSQCRTVAVGSKPCGGARYYYPYSTMDTAVSQLFDSVADYNRMDKKRTPSEQEASDCRLINDPGAQCSAGRCMLGSPP